MSAFPVRPDAFDRIEFEERLTEELQAATAALHSASAQLTRAIEDCKALRMKSKGMYDFQPGEEYVSVEDLLRIHRDALVKYRQALENCNNFILHGQLAEFPKPHSPAILSMTSPEERPRPSGRDQNSWTVAGEPSV